MPFSLFVHHQVGVWSCYLLYWRASLALGQHLVVEISGMPLLCFFVPFGLKCSYKINFSFSEILYFCKLPHFFCHITHCVGSEQLCTTLPPLLYFYVLLALPLVPNTFCTSSRVFELKLFQWHTYCFFSLLLLLITYWYPKQLIHCVPCFLKRSKSSAISSKK